MLKGWQRLQGRRWADAGGCVAAALPQDSDERAVAFIAGKAPTRWGPFGAAEPPRAPAGGGPPLHPPAHAAPAELARAAQVRRAHPLYADVSLRLLTEIMNSRLFTTVRAPAGTRRPLPRLLRAGACVRMPGAWLLHLRSSSWVCLTRIVPVWSCSCMAMPLRGHARRA